MQRLNEIMKKIEEIDYSLETETQKRLDNLTKPQGSLGRLEELAKRMVAITRNPVPPVANKVIFTMAGDHGITEEGVSAYPKEVTPQMVYNFLKGGAGINVLARHVGARVVIVDMGVACDLEEHPSLIIKKVNYGTKNMTKVPAISREEAINSIENGMDIFEKEFLKGIDMVGTGDMGIGNTTPSSAITSVITGKPVENVTGRGTGIDDGALSNKIAMIKKAIGMNMPEVPEVKDYMIAAHCSVEMGHRAALDHIGLRPLLDLNLRLGEGTGAALGMSIVEASVKILTEMATFKSAAVSEKD